MLNKVRDIIMKRNKKGFTLVEVLVVVLIISILAAIAVPSYNFAVERSRASQGITSLTQIASAQKNYVAKKGNYSETMLNLPLQMNNQDGSAVVGAEFSDKFFDYEIFGDDEEASVARRNNGEYELSIDYNTGKIFCRPIEHKICRDLNLDEGRSFEPVWDDCNGVMNEIWALAGITKDYEADTNTCKVLVNKRQNRTDFEFCFNDYKHRFIVNTTNIATSTALQCVKGYTTNSNRLVLMECRQNPDFSQCTSNYTQIIEKDENGTLWRFTCTKFDYETETCVNKNLFYFMRYEKPLISGYCTKFDEQNRCVSCNPSSACSIVEGKDLPI